MLPQQFLTSIEHVAGYNKDAFIAIHESKEQVTTIRLNKQKVVNVEGAEEQVPWCADGFYLQERPLFTLDPLLHAGAYYVQEASSMFLHYLLNNLTNINERFTILDACAAPGGKSTLLASLFSNSLIVSNEIIKQRAAILTENATKWGTPNILVTNNDASHFTKLQGLFDIIVIDAPCSGSGMFRKDSNAIEEWSLANVAACSQRQTKILQDVWPALKEGGTLIYSTCSYSKEENEDILDYIMQHFEVESLYAPIPNNWGIVTTISDKYAAKGYRFYPYLLKGEGLFMAAFKKVGGTVKAKHKPVALQKPNAIIASHLQDILTEDFSRYTFFTNEQTVKCIIKGFEDILPLLFNNLYIKKAGVALFEQKGKDMIPLHDLAVSTLSLSNIATIEVNKETAISFLKRKDVQIETAERGWVRLTYNGLGIGFVKVLPNRINNYYPQEWRILKE